MSLSDLKSHRLDERVLVRYSSIPFKFGPGATVVADQDTTVGVSPKGPSGPGRTSTRAPVRRARPRDVSSDLRRGPGRSRPCVSGLGWTGPRTLLPPVYSLRHGTGPLPSSSPSVGRRGPSTRVRPDGSGRLVSSRGRGPVRGSCTVCVTGPLRGSRPRGTPVRGHGRE